MSDEVGTIRWLKSPVPEAKLGTCDNGKKVVIIDRGKRRIYLEVQDFSEATVTEAVEKIKREFEIERAAKALRDVSG